MASSPVRRSMFPGLAARVRPPAPEADGKAPATRPADVAPWSTLEPRAKDGVIQATRVLRRGIGRPLITLLVAVALALATVGTLVLLEPPYQPQYVLRVVETDRDPGSMPRPRRQLRQYVLDAVFTSHALFGIIKKYKLYPALMRNSPRAAMESFRDDIDVGVYRNYFVEARSAHEPPRSARVVVRYRCDDPVLALAVTRELGKLIERRERDARAREAAQAARIAKHSLDRLEKAALARREQIATKQIEIRDETTVDPQREVELVGLLGTLDSLEKEVAAAQRVKTELDLGAAYERNGAGLRFEVVDDGSITKANRLQPVHLVGIGLASFVLGLPLAALAVGAFAPRGERR